MRTLAAELIRALSRRLTRVLVVVALAVTAVTMIWVFIATKGDAERQQTYEAHLNEAIQSCIDDPYRWSQPYPEILEGESGGTAVTIFPERDKPDLELTEEEKRERCTADARTWISVEGPFELKALWDPDNEEGILLIPATLLLLCGLGAGASMIGGEWKANTVTTLLVWEPRRGRLLASRMAASFIAAAVIAIMLQLAFSAAFIPAAALKGSMDGLDSAWWSDYIQAVVRISALTGGAAVLGVSLGSLARSTAGGMGTAVVWLAVGESILSALRPTLAEWLIAPNLAVLTIVEGIEDENIVITVADAATRLSIYLAIVVAVALVLFQRRDVAG